MRKTFLALSLLLLCGMTVAGNKKATTAKFDYFEYVGQDDFYNENPLPDASSFYNPIVPGWHSDPSICREGEDYFMVMSTFTYFPGVPLYHSRDLVNWRLVGNVLSRESQLLSMRGQAINTGGIYAPAISYNPHNKTYYMVTTNVGVGNFYVTTKDPFGEWSEPVILHDIKGIDPSFFFDDDGSAYLIHKEDVTGKPKWCNHRAIRISRFDTATGQTYGEDMPFSELGVGPEERLDRDEGPHIYKINGYYYVLCAEGGTSWAHSEVVYRAESVLGPYTRWSRNPMLTQRLLKTTRSNPVTCTGHVDLIDTPNGEWWAVFLGTRPMKGQFETLGRETFMMPVRWSADGFPYMTQSKDTIPWVLRREGVTREAATTYGNFTWRDDFDSKTLCPEWVMLRGSAQKYYKTGKGLRLQCAPYTTSQKEEVPAFVGRRLQHHKYTATTAVRFSPRAGERAGMLLLRDEGRQYFMAVGADDVTLYKIGRKGEETLARHTLQHDGKPVSLRVVSHGFTYDFYYSTDGTTWTQLCSGIDASHLSCGGFTGSIIGMYAVSE
ncbi:MAG: glycoside hydrolase family 43 protein [Coprobacter sp.]|nr:glycoside hydrolase family 43 protein [Coprobacter sp.]